MPKRIVVALVLTATGCGPATTPCEDQCDPGGTSCAEDGRVISCVGPDGDGCFDWGSPMACAEHQRCVDGACRCEDICEPGAVACGPEGGRISCAGPGPEGGCFAWGDEEPCGLHQLCTGGECLCRNACAPGTPVCDGPDAVAFCVGPDADGCTYFGDAESCPAYRHCDSTRGRCERDTPSECYSVNQCDFEGQLLCMDETRFRTCFRTRMGCLLWDGCET
jgi:hypothetical protein